MHVIWRVWCISNHFSCHPHSAQGLSDNLIGAMGSEEILTRQGVANHDMLLSRLMNMGFEWQTSLNALHATQVSSYWQIFAYVWWSSAYIVIGRWIMNVWLFRMMKILDNDISSLTLSNRFVKTVNYIILFRTTYKLGLREPWISWSMMTLWRGHLPQSLTFHYSVSDIDTF